MNFKHLSVAYLALAGTAAYARHAIVLNESEVVEVPRSNIKTYLQKETLQDNLKPLKSTKPSALNQEDLLAIPARYLPPELQKKQQEIREHVEAQKKEKLNVSTTVSKGRLGEGRIKLRAKDQKGIVELKIEDAVWVPPTAASAATILKPKRLLPDVEVIQAISVETSGEVKKEIKPGEQREVDEVFDYGQVKDKARERLVKAYEFYKAQDYATSVTLALDVLSSAKSQDEKVNARYLAAHSLFQAGFYASALQQLVELSDSKWRRSAIGMAALAIEKTRDDSAAYQILAKVSLSQIAEEHQALFSFHLGRVLMDTGAGQAALAAFAKVPETHARYPEARYYIGVILASELPGKIDPSEWDNAKSGVYEARSYFEAALLAARAENASDLRDLIFLSLARLAYQTQQFHQATYYYQSVATLSPFARESIFESAWALYRLGEFNRSLGTLHPLGTPYFEGRDFPELWILRSLNYLKLCRFEEAQRAANSFEAQFKTLTPELAELQKKLKGIKLKAPSDLNNADLPEWVKSWVMADPVIQKDVTRESLYRRERERLATIKDNERIPDPELRTVALEALEKQIDRKVASTARTIAPYIAGRFADLLGEYKRQKERTDFLRFEIYNQATRFPKALERPQARKLLEDGEFLPGVFLKGKETLWRFSGEYWEDEVRGYDYFVPTECQA